VAVFRSVSFEFWEDLQEREPAVDDQFCSGREARVIRREVERGGSNFLGFTGPLQRHPPDHLTEAGYLFWAQTHLPADCLRRIILHSSH